ncbi:MAG: 8-amino-7-oxononanoate synthase [Candidatus Margulisiibacteriota bacterium]
MPNNPQKWQVGFLKTQAEKGLRRTLHPANWRKDGKISIRGKEYFDFSSNDYLGLASHPALIAAAHAAAEKWGTGTCASRLLSGDLEIHHELEEKIAALKGKPAGLLFNSGYQANVGIIPALFEKGDAIFSDRLNHASIIDGILLSGAQMFRFHHNDPMHLEMLLKKYRHKYRRALIITETIFSMDGDRCPLKNLVTLKEKYNCILMVDEAHATGIFGKNGAGIVEEEGLASQVDIIMGTFGKALGSFGAYVTADKTCIEYLINTGRSFIYSTALPPAVVAANLAAIDLLRTEPERRRLLLKNARVFRQKLVSAGHPVCGQSQIVPVIIGSAEVAVKISKKLQAAGYWTLPIRPPTVPQNESRIRFSLSYNHSQAVLEKLTKEITRNAPAA